jgi:hypothetical protein
MSDTKWRELFVALDEHGGPGLAFLKVLGVPNEHEVWGGFGALFLDKSAIDTFCGALSFRDIEWLEVPRVYAVKPDRTVPAKVFTQDIEAIRQMLQDLGQYPLEETARGLRVIGHLTP